MKKIIFTTMILSLFVSGLHAGGGGETEDDHHDESSHHQLEPVELTGDQKLQVTVSTSILGDVVRQVAADAADVRVLMENGEDPHSYEPTPRQMALLEGSHVLFVNGFDLEEGLLKTLENVSSGPVIEASREVDVIRSEMEEDHQDEDHDADHHDEDHHDENDHDEEHYEEDHHDEDDHDEGHEDEHHEADDHDDEHHDHDHSGVDPHTWLSIENVRAWVEVIEESLSALNPDRSAEFQANAQEYLQELKALEDFTLAEINKIPEANRVIVADHKVFGYFARDFGFEALDAVKPTFSTAAEVSPRYLAELTEVLEGRRVPAIFVGSTAGNELGSLVEALTQELNYPIKVVSYLSGALTPEQDTFVKYFRYNVQQLVTGLSEE